MTGETSQGLRQASVRAVTGTLNDYNGDFSALFTGAGIADGPDFNGRLLAWVNLKLSAAYTDLGGALDALATANGAYNWSSLGTFDASIGPVTSNKILLEDGSGDILLETSGYILLET